MKKKKSLGQNFFVNKNLAERIVNILLKDSPNTVVEIGPGGGYFTDLISPEVKHLLLIEKDDNLSLQLSAKYPQSNVINIDFLDWDFSELDKYKKEKIVFFGSLPYNVSKKIIRKIMFSEYFQQPSFFIIQKEVAEKYIAKEPDNNVLALETALFADCKKLFDISPDSFRPRPKVTSSLIQFTPNNRLNIGIENIENFVYFLFDCFNHPRRTVGNNLKKYDLKSSEITKILEKRPEHLSLDEYFLLYSSIKKE